MKIDEIADKKRAGDWIGGSPFDAVSGNETAVAEICRLGHSRRCVGDLDVQHRHKSSENRAEHGYPSA